ncbi:hypothetical protein BD309DRAFT_870807 [Dichomitus squalens]|uniref:Uncharacterized protein n=1 Tax=Dichomitus squalens TaxID=114155 RepID=A0A4Q9NI18_9APHY|nr:hypothetical protein BD311DRAFT_753292 [Dichomitus squalens]TBU40175.1 hypothetical protein BD309DRAFT_870807 [Dichomitus squalens]TBU52928.1 hypothetical protein BD310DRAFT_939047 [Dichomitus squalens]
MRPSGPSFIRAVTCLRPCQAVALSARRGLTTLPRPKPLGPLPCSNLNSFFTRRRTLLATESRAPPTASQTSDAPKAPPEEHPATANDLPEDEEYHGPLTTTFRRLKILSLSSLTLTFALTPFIFVLETTSSVPVAGRFALAGIAMATSGVSTFLVAWCGRPYVTTLRRLPSEGGAGAERAIEMTTLTLGLHKRVTTVFDTAFLVPTSRPFATWELAEAFKLPDAEVTSARAQGLIPREETIAETRTKDGDLLGRWIVSWDENGLGTCKEVGQVARYFNVHHELMSRPIR